MAKSSHWIEAWRMAKSSHRGEAYRDSKAFFWSSADVGTMCKDKCLLTTDQYVQKIATATSASWLFKA